MPTYICERCLKEFGQKSHYNKHLNKKRPCQDNRGKIEEVVENIITKKNIIMSNNMDNNNNNIEHTMKDKTESLCEKFEQLDIENKPIRVIDLFAGTGAFTHAFESDKKFQSVYANDMIKSSKNIYELNYPSHKFEMEDLNKINVNNIPAHDMLCGGFPCQPFSIAGDKKGFDDERSNVFWKIIEILNKHKPEIILLENVKNLKSHDKGKTYAIIEENLKKCGYHIKTAILDTSKITNVPQHRERIYIIGFRNKCLFDKFEFDFSEKTKGEIKDFLETGIPDKYYYTDKFKVFGEIQNEVKKNISENVLYQYRRYYVRENKSNACPTLTANMGGGGHNVPLLKDNHGIRKLTPRECFNLQGFPQNYKLPNLSDSDLYKLAGNAVSVPVVKLIVKRLSSIIV